MPIQDYYKNQNFELPRGTICGTFHQLPKNVYDREDLKDRITISMRKRVHRKKIKNIKIIHHCKNDTHFASLGT